MSKIGIMQGRLIPECIEKLQIFPKSHWKEEFAMAIDMGFEHFELLYDKEFVLSDILEDEANHVTLGITDFLGDKIVKSRSACLDFLADISLLNENTRQQFICELIRVMRTVKHSNIDVLVIPFCDRNNISSADELKLIMACLAVNGLDNLAFEYGLKLALELTLSSNDIVSGFINYSSKDIGVCFDLGNSRAAGFKPEVEIQNLGSLIKHVHIKDRKIGGPNAMLGDGDVDFSACAQSLKKVGYIGSLVLETRYFVDPVKEASLNLEYAKRLFSENLA